MKFPLFFCLFVLQQGRVLRVPVQGFDVSQTHLQLVKMYDNTFERLEVTSTFLLVAWRRDHISITFIVSSWKHVSAPQSWREMLIWLRSIVLSLMYSTRVPSVCCQKMCLFVHSLHVIQIMYTLYGLYSEFYSIVCTVIFLRADLSEYLFQQYGVDLLPKEKGGWNKVFFFSDELKPLYQHLFPHLCVIKQEPKLWIIQAKHAVNQ